MNRLFRHSLPLLLILLTLTVTLPAHATDTSHPDGDGVWPLSPRPEVVSDFAPPSSAWGAGHRGVDLAGSPGQGVRAALPGRVTFAGRLAGRGVVVVSHGTTRTTYEPVTAHVQRGEPVRAGETVGSLELFGSHCFPRACLHWGLLEGDRYLDPLALVGAGPVRLLPWLTGAGSAGLPDGRGSPTLPTYSNWRPLGSGPMFRH